jgi:hypothetical protein
LQGGSFLAQKQDLRSSNIEGCQAVGLCQSCEYGKAEDTLIELDGAIHVVNVECGFEDAVNPKHAYSLFAFKPVRSRFHATLRKLTSSRELGQVPINGISGNWLPHFEKAPYQIEMRRPVSAGCDTLPMFDVLEAQRKGDRQCRRLALYRGVEAGFSQGAS